MDDLSNPDNTCVAGDDQFGSGESATYAMLASGQVEIIGIPGVDFTGFAQVHLNTTSSIQTLTINTDSDGDTNTEDVTVEFTESGVRRVAEVAYHVNENTENIGARRLHTVMERLLETISFEASDKSGTHVQVNAGYVDDHLAELSKDEDLSRYIL